MSSIARRLPQSNPTRKLALQVAQFKQNDPGPAGSALTPPTVARLAASEGAYSPAMLLESQRKSQQINAVIAKNFALNILRLLAKHFIGVFNYGVERSKYPAADRPYYGIDAENENLPVLDTELQVIDLASQIVGNDPQRVLNGGAAMANPDAAEVNLARTAYLPLLTASNNAKTSHDMAQEATDALNPEADKVIKKVWDEVETFFNEQTPESMRNDARQWGVVYVTKGPPAILTGLVKDGTGQPRDGAEATVEQTGATATTNNEGRYVVETNLVGPATIIAAFADGTTGTVTINIPEDHEGIEIEVPDIILA